MELEPLIWIMKAEKYVQHLTCQLFGTGCTDLFLIVQKLTARPNFSTELKELFLYKKKHFTIQTFLSPRTLNRTTSSLVKIVPASLIDLCLLIVYSSIDF